MRTVSVVGILCAALLGALWLYSYPRASITPVSDTILPTKHITIGNVPLTVEVASTDSEREQGLSGREGLAENTGMLFVFAVPKLYGFWMKDMRFALDIIFVDASGSVVTIASNLLPQTYPEVFQSKSPALYVLEVPAGFAKEHGIAVGTKIVLQ